MEEQNRTFKMFLFVHVYNICCFKDDKESDLYSLQIARLTMRQFWTMMTLEKVLSWTKTLRWQIHFYIFHNFLQWEKKTKIIQEQHHFFYWEYKNRRPTNELLFTFLKAKHISWQF